MIYDQNLHTHTTYSDGKNTPEEMILKAISLGFKSIGFSDHACMDFPATGAIKREKIDERIAEIKNLKEKYKGKIEVYLGLENDLFSPQDLTPYEYVIGSAHCIKLGENIIEFDGGKDQVKDVIDRLFNGNGLEFAKLYYQTFEKLKDSRRIDIVGHCDLVSKHSENENFFDSNCKEYKEFALSAIRKVFKRCQVFEINTGAIARGYRTTPYPAPFIMQELKKLGAKMIISSDCHNQDFLDCHFEDSIKYLKSFGFDKVYKFENGEFVGYGI